MAAHPVSLLLCIPTVVCAYLSDDGTPLEEVMVRGHRDSRRLKLVPSGLFQGSCVHALCIYPITMCLALPLFDPVSLLSFLPCNLLGASFAPPSLCFFPEHCRLDLVYLAWPL